MTPSEAHDSAWQREPEHDEMVAAVLKRARKALHTWETEDVCLRLVWAKAEVMFTRQSARLFFADVALFYEDAPGRKAALRIFEVKHKIYSAGAVVRQARVLTMGAIGWLQEQRSGWECWVSCMPVVRWDDPRAQLTADLFGEGGIATWNGSALRLLPASE